MPQHYPFSAVLGCAPDALDDMGLALVLTTISPEIGGVLIRGEKGTAKSTAVRGLAAVLPPVDVFTADRFSVDPDDSRAESPDGPFASGAERQTRPVRLVEMPVGATEDRVLGSLHLERALSAGKVEFEPGLLARAHRGVLYVDEINLLHDHLVDLLLDAAAMGRVSVERDGMSVEHAARFVLIGTMNPEEGELRPQLLDRFGLAVEVAAPRDPQARAEVVSRRLAFDADPQAFTERYRAADESVQERLVAARARVGTVRLSPAAVRRIAVVCAGFEVDGLRADIVTARTAVAHAAWWGRDEVTRADIRRAALLTLPHRRRRNPFDAPGLDEELLDRLLGEDELPPDPPDDPGPSGDGPAGSDESEPTGPDAPGPESAGAGGDGTGDAQTSAPPPGTTRNASDPPVTEAEANAQGPSPSPSSPDASDPAVTRAVAGTPYRPRAWSVAGVGEGSSGRRSRARSDSGRRVGARPGTTGSVHLVETLQAAAGRQASRNRPGNRVVLAPEDLRVGVKEGKEANLVLFCVDASGSMAARRRMEAVKTAVLSLLLDAYRRRDKVGLVTFRGTQAEVVLPPTRSVDIAAARLDSLPAGGRTPLAEGLLRSAEVLIREHRRDPRLRPLLIVVTDGRATGGKNAVDRSRLAADHLRSWGVTTLVIDTESGPMRLGLAAELAEHLAAEHVPVTEVSADALGAAVRGHGAEPGRRVA